MPFCRIVWVMIEVNLGAYRVASGNSQNRSYRVERKRKSFNIRCDIQAMSDDKDLPLTSALEPPNCALVLTNSAG